MAQKNILLINLALKANTGGILQVFALQNLLESWGYNVIKAEKKQHHEFQFTFHQFSLLLKRLFLRYVFRKDISLLPELIEDKINFLPYKLAREFIKKHIKIIEIDSLSQLNGSQFDVVIVGSDQVWRHLYTYDLLTNKSKADNAFLAFTKGWKCFRIAYGASFGVDNWEYSNEETIILRELILHFNAISVREDTAINLIHRHLDKTLQVEHVLDPTFLIPKETYINLVKKAKTVPSSGNLLLYILDSSDNKKQFIKDFISQNEYSPFYVNNPKHEDSNYPPEERIQISVEQWIRGFIEAEFVIADSFHACVFSIIFEKPFLVLTNPKRGNTRIESLMRMFNLSNRIIDADKPSICIRNLQEIDWKAVSIKKKELHERSIHFLKEALNSNEYK